MNWTTFLLVLLSFSLGFWAGVVFLWAYKGERELKYHNEKLSKAIKKSAENDRYFPNSKI